MQLATAFNNKLSVSTWATVTVKITSSQWAEDWRRGGSKFREHRQFCRLEVESVWGRVKLWCRDGSHLCGYVCMLERRRTPKVSTKSPSQDGNLESVTEELWKAPFHSQSGTGWVHLDASGAVPENNYPPWKPSATCGYPKLRGPPRVRKAYQVPKIWRKKKKNNKFY